MPNIDIKSTRPIDPFEYFTAQSATEELIAAGGVCKWVHFQEMTIHNGDIKMVFFADGIITGDYNDTEYEWSVTYLVSQKRGVVDVEMSQYVRGHNLNEAAAAATTARLTAEREADFKSRHGILRS